MPRTVGRWAAAALSALLVAGGLAQPTPALAAPDARSEHQRTVDFWTVERVKQARSRDFVFDEATGTFRLDARQLVDAKPVKPGKPDPTRVLGADWTAGGAVQATTGKVLYAMGGGYYICSASVAKEGSKRTSVILTAGHCVYDNEGGAFATHWTFIPDYDATPVELTTTGSFCAQTRYGCWTADALTASDDFVAQSTFNTTATLHDYAFATVGGGGLDGSTQLDKAVGAQAISFSPASPGATTHLFGYPAGLPYDGSRLIYSRGALGFDPLNGNDTYRVASDQTSGCSGGPWFQGFAAGAGTMVSVNSYSYSSVRNAEHGPILNDETAGMFAAALGANADVVYVG